MPAIKLITSAMLLLYTDSSCKLEKMVTHCLELCAFLGYYTNTVPLLKSLTSSSDAKCHNVLIQTPGQETVLHG